MFLKIRVRIDFLSDDNVASLILPSLDDTVTVTNV